MSKKLDFSWDNSLDCYVAKVSDTLRVRAVRDESPQNPFEDWDGHWPMTVGLSDSRAHDSRSNAFKDYDKAKGPGSQDVLQRFNDHLIVHFQVHLARAFGFMGTCALVECYGTGDCDGAWCTDPEVIRDAVAQALDDVPNSHYLAQLAELYTLLGIPCLVDTSTGYSQGDQVEVLVVATPEAVEEFGCKEPIEPSDLESQVKLYGAWAWGDVYGYVIEKWEASDPEDPDLDPDFDEGEWVEQDSCWGYYGDDFDESGLADAAAEALPDDVFMKELVHA